MPAALAAFATAGCTPAVLDPAGPVGGAEKAILIDSVVIMLAIIVPTIVATLAFAWWFRASNARARYRPDWAYSGSIELMTWAAPLLIIMLLGGVTWIGAHELDPARRLPSRTPPLEVQVVALDWKWLFIYPGQRVASVNYLAMPAGRPVHFSLTSASVLNSFFIPQLGTMIYTMSGMATQLNLQADHPGTFSGMSSHYSGDGFSDMHFKVDAMTDAGFKSWVAATRATGPALDDSSYGRLEKQSINVRPFTYSSAEPDIFTKIVMQTVAPAPGPQGGTHDIHVSPHSSEQ